jgi:hypothetical protein
MFSTDRYYKCAKPDCFRKIKQGIAYCCYACSLADKGGYEIHEDGILGHSDLCNAHSKERGEFTQTPGRWPNDV